MGILRTLRRRHAIPARKAMQKKEYERYAMNERAEGRPPKKYREWIRGALQKNTDRDVSERKPKTTSEEPK